MKLLHTADWHLGKALYGRSMLEEQKWFLMQWLLPLIEQEKPDAVLLAGDIFDRQVPPVEAVELLNTFLCGLAQQGVPLVAVSGNHDSARRLSLGTSLLRREKVVLATRPEEVWIPYTIQTADGPLCCYTLPYCEPAAARQALQVQEDGPRTMDTAFRALLARVHLDPTAKNVLITHCFAAGGRISASENPAFVGGSSQVGLDCFAPFDYVALGHLHASQKAGTGRYAGSPLKYSFDEADQKKGVTLVTLDSTGTHTQVVAIIPPHDVRVLSGRFEELLAAAKETPSKDYLQVRLTDTSPVFQPMDQLRTYYPNLLHLSSDWLLSAGDGEDSAFCREMRCRRVSDEQIFTAFLQQICGTEPTEQDLALFRKEMKKEGQE
ncbi:exonuclease SbcCD subunit D [Caproicibacterium lactatifermentans]|uniref:Nuclease SbcCD subunit D n=1 Tax=Caproicibacterium lactatifermentans TaxID=2666138 RepID=A0ABX6PUS0_9FIRM|nr:exonuclease SbcCD subunit D [Caproicibacterium lactatifermentans]QKO30024.1 exonuclease subunit SbcD [Caproicibacterium lactatifermentans]